MVMAQMRKEPGVKAVLAGRAAEEKHVVSQVGALAAASHGRAGCGLRPLHRVLDYQDARPPARCLHLLHPHCRPPHTPQDIELYLTRKEVNDGFNVVARIGKQLRELHISTDLSRDEMKATLRRVIKRVVQLGSM